MHGAHLGGADNRASDSSTENADADTHPKGRNQEADGKCRRVAWWQLAHGAVNGWHWPTVGLQSSVGGTAARGRNWERWASLMEHMFFGRAYISTFIITGKS